MTPDIANSTFVDAPHFETLFHTGEKAFYLRPKGMNQFEAIAELGIVPIYLREYLSFPTIYPANPRIRVAFCLLLAFTEENNSIYFSECSDDKNSYDLFFSLSTIKRLNFAN